MFGRITITLTRVVKRFISPFSHFGGQMHTISGSAWSFMNFSSRAWYWWENACGQSGWSQMIVSIWFSRAVTLWIMLLGHWVHRTIFLLFAIGFCWNWFRLLPTSLESDFDSRTYNYVCQVVGHKNSTKTYIYHKSIRELRNKCLAKKQNFNFMK